MKEKTRFFRYLELSGLGVKEYCLYNNYLRHVDKITGQPRVYFEFILTVIARDSHRREWNKGNDQTRRLLRIRTICKIMANIPMLNKSSEFKSMFELKRQEYINENKNNYY